ncbi:hypothetical protein MACH24_04700 [Erythrobacter sp. Dej080120_24]|uniref:hypothetical protein n=1 Tax=unclassified Erythrobacter TaxID=2633097 RepID=UPI00291D6700|nr:hypothetical protein MACH24_04700 [Erythrobacter sp. Dej080120_24]
MSAMSPEAMREMRKIAGGSDDPVSTMSRRWDALHETANRLAQMAHLSPDRHLPATDAFSEMLDHATGWQRELAAQGIDDIDAMMQPGMAALTTLVQRGQDATAPALALWCEFHHARDAVLSAVRPYPA